MRLLLYDLSSPALQGDYYFQTFPPIPGRTVQNDALPDVPAPSFFFDNSLPLPLFVVRLESVHVHFIVFFSSRIVASLS